MLIISNHNKMDVKNLMGQVINDYKIEKSIGLGKFGVVYIGSKNDHLYILKFVHSSQFNKNEIEVFKKVSELCLNDKANYIEEFVLNDYNVIVSNYLENSIDLFDYIERVKDPNYIKKYNITESVIQYNIVKIMQCLFEQLDCMHLNNIVHMDIKPENILLQKNSQFVITYATFIDFGLSCTKDMYDATNGVVCQTSGTLEYMAPELIMQYSKKIIPNKTYSFAKPLTLNNYKKTDIWSLGLTFYLLITNSLPYELIKSNYTDYHSIIEYYYNIQDSQISIVDAFTDKEYQERYLPYQEFYDFLNSLINRMLQYDSDKRLNANILKKYI